MSAIERFEYFKSKFVKTDLWRAMQLERENSPWHREENVAVHTNMLLKWYMDNLYSARNEEQRVLTMVACLMHDIGKPPSRIVKVDEETGVSRNAYHGHEMVSASMWREFAIGNTDVRDILTFDQYDISYVASMIEHHVPFGLKNVIKRKAMKANFHHRKGAAGHRAWLDMLLSDQHGRISDDQAQKLQAVNDWMYHWEQLDWEQK